MFLIKKSTLVPRDNFPKKVLSIKYLPIEDFSEANPDELVPQASSTEDNLLEYDGLDCSPTTVISFCAKAIAAPWTYTRHLSYMEHSMWLKKIKYDSGIYLPKGVATVNQFICPSLESAFHSLTKCHPALNDETLVSVATNNDVTTNYICGLIYFLEKGSLLNLELPQESTSSSELLQKSSFQL